MYDFVDSEKLEMVKLSLDEAFVIPEQNAALNFIATCRFRPGVTKDKRIKYSREIFQKEMLPTLVFPTLAQRRRLISSAK